MKARQMMNPRPNARRCRPGAPTRRDVVCEFGRGHALSSAICPTRPNHHYPGGVNAFRPGLARSAYPGNKPQIFFRFNPEGVEENHPETRAAQYLRGHMAGVICADSSSAIVDNACANIPEFNPFRVEKRRIFLDDYQGRRSRANPGLNASRTFGARQTTRRTIADEFGAGHPSFGTLAALSALPNHPRVHRWLLFNNPPHHPHVCP